MFKHIFREIFQIPLCEEITALKILTTAYNSLYEKIFSPILFPRIVLCTCMRRLRTPFRPSIFTISYESAMKVNLYYQAYFYKWHVWLFTFVSLIQIKITKMVFLLFYSISNKFWFLRLNTYVINWVYSCGTCVGHRKCQHIDQSPRSWNWDKIN